MVLGSLLCSILLFFRKNGNKSEGLYLISSLNLYTRRIVAMTTSEKNLLCAKYTYNRRPTIRMVRRGGK